MLKQKHQNMDTYFKMSDDVSSVLMSCWEVDRSVQLFVRKACLFEVAFIWIWIWMAPSSSSYTSCANLPSISVLPNLVRKPLEKHTPTAQHSLGSKQTIHFLLPVHKELKNARTRDVDSKIISYGSIWFHIEKCYLACLTSWLGLCALECVSLSL